MQPVSSLLVPQLEQMFAADTKSELIVVLDRPSGSSMMGVTIQLNRKPMVGVAGSSLEEAWAFAMRHPGVKEIPGWQDVEDKRNLKSPIASVAIIYTLSEKGRRQSRLAGGDGKHLQLVIVRATVALIEMATIHEDGTAAIYLTEWLPTPQILNDAGTDEYTTRIMRNFRESGRPCPRRKVVVTHDVPDASYESGKRLVKLGRLGEGEGPGPGCFDYDEPFTEAALVDHVLNLEARYTAHLITVQHKIDRENAEDRQRLREELARGHERVQSWLNEPNTQVRLDSLNPGQEISRANFGEDPTVFLIGDSDRKVVVAEVTHRTLSSSVVRVEGRQDKAGLAVLSRAARETWISQFGSDQLRQLMIDGKADDNVKLYHRERITKEVGPEWDWVAFSLGDYREDPLQKVSQSMADTVLDFRGRFPKANVRLRRIIPKNSSSTWMPPVPYLIMDCPWDIDLPSLATAIHE
jgi:hypothetical protein